MADLDDEGTVGRREAIKKGAAIAGGVWAVPAIVSMATPAYAVGSIEAAGAVRDRLPVRGASHPQRNEQHVQLQHSARRR